MRVVSAGCASEPTLLNQLRGEAVSPSVIAPTSSGNEVVSVEQVDPKVLRVKRASIRSRHVIAAARDDLERHQQWLDRHRTAWAEDVKRYERRLSCKLGIKALKRLALGLLLIGPIVCLALLRLIARILPKARILLFRNVAWFRALAQHVISLPWPRLRPNAARYVDVPRYHDRIPGLDGPLCTGQPPSPHVMRTFRARAVSGEAGLLQTRLIVASLAAVIVGLVAAATAYDRPAPGAVLPNALAHAGRPAALPPAVPSETPEDVPVSGFAVLAAAPAVERVSPPGATIAEIISIAHPLTDALEQPNATTEPLEVTLPDRKPKIRTKAKAKLKPKPQNRQLTVWERLPWLR